MDLKNLDPKMQMLLLCKPKRNEAVKWEEEDDRIILIYPKNFTRFERFLHRHIGGPGTIRRPLDDKGTFIWRMCDGDHNVHDICQASYNEFKEDIEPVLRRVWGFLEILLKLNLIIMETPKKKKDDEKETDVKEELVEKEDLGEKDKNGEKNEQGEKE
ncbi:MAG: PqqD family protein [Thermoplasmata archaeon]|nr:MAG: PqqD family protein [Thermoplasmata archaeon]